MDNFVINEISREFLIVSVLAMALQLILAPAILETPLNFKSIEERNEFGIFENFILLKFFSESG